MGEVLGLGECVILFRGLGVLGAHALTASIFGYLGNSRVRGLHCWGIYLRPYFGNWQITNGPKVMDAEAMC